MGLLTNPHTPPLTPSKGPILLPSPRDISLSPFIETDEMPPAAVQNGDESVPKPHLIFVYGTLKHGFPNHHLMEDLIRSNDAVPLMTTISSSPTSNSPTSYYSYRTAQPYPLVRGPLGIPYLLNIQGSGHHVHGELYSVSARGLIRLDELEGISYGHYERLPIKIVKMEVVKNKEHDRNSETKKSTEEVRNHNEEIKKQDGQDQNEEKMETHEEGECGDGGNNKDDGDKRTPVLSVIEVEAYYAHRSYAEDMWRKSGMVGMEEYTVADSDIYVKPENRPAVGRMSFVDRIRAYVASSD